MRDRETIDSDLRLLALRRQALREQGGEPSSQQVDELLDERLGHREAQSETTTARDATHAITPQRRRPPPRKSALRRFGPLALLPLSLLAVVTAIGMTFGAHQQQPTESADPAEIPPSSTSQPSPPAPQAQAPPVDIADRVLVDVLKQDGVPVPSHEYVHTQGRAVCDFLARDPDFGEAVNFVQRSSIWDATQSANFTAGAVVSYCPQYQPTSPKLQPAYQNSLTEVQAIQRDLQAIEGGLQGIRDGLPALPGQ